jgi:uncharacterized protein
MIRKLTEKDRESVMAFVGKEPALNLFLIGDIENFGFDNEFQEIWGEFDAADGRLKAVLLRYYGSFLPYAVGGFDVTGFADIVMRSERREMVSGPTHVAEMFRGALKFRKEKHMFFAELAATRRLDAGMAYYGESEIKHAAVDDVEAVCELMDQIEEFQTGADSRRDVLRRTLASGTGRTYMVKRDGKVIASASTSAENSMSAMVVGVATHPEHRGQGLATRLVTKLCADVLAEGRSLCLFYDNPSAGAIYKRIGFEDIGKWSMMYIDPA